MFTIDFIKNHEGAQWLQVALEGRNSFKCESLNVLQKKEKENCFQTYININDQCPLRKLLELFQLAQIVNEIAF